MFQKAKFKSQLEKLMNGTTAIEFSERTGFNRTYLSKFLNLKMDRPPSAHLLKNIAGPAVSYEELMISCGYLNTEAVMPQSCIQIPVLGHIHAGAPGMATESLEGYETVPSSDICAGHEYFYLRVEGDSMMNARILNGDLVFVRKQSDVESGDIAVVMIEGENATLKRVLKKNNIVVLQPENPAYPSHIFAGDDLNNLEILGKVLHVKFSLT